MNDVEDDGVEDVDVREDKIGLLCMGMFVYY